MPAYIYYYRSKVDVVGLEPTTFGLRDRYSNQLSYTSIVHVKGFEPPTDGLKARYSTSWVTHAFIKFFFLFCHISLKSPSFFILLSTLLFKSSWKTGIRTHTSPVQRAYATITTISQSGWQDSNLRPPGPKPGALAKLSHTPKYIKLSRKPFDFQSGWHDSNVRLHGPKPRGLPTDLHPVIKFYLWDFSQYG